MRSERLLAWAGSLCAVACLLGCGPSGRVVLAPNATNPSIRRVAVLDFEFPHSPDFFALVAFLRQPEEAGRIVADQVSQELISLGRYEIVERKQLRRILEEKKLQGNDLLESQNLADIGKLLKVDALVLGTVEECSFVFFTFGWRLGMAFNARLVEVNAAGTLWSISDRRGEFYSFSSHWAISSSQAQGLVRRLGKELARQERVGK